VPILIALVLIALGAAILIYAPAIQRTHIAMAGRPRNWLAAASLKIAASDASLNSIRMAGVILLVAGIALLGALLVAALRAP
jgi:hypothetical protein